MGFSKGNESTEALQYTKYIGVASVFVKGVNPTKSELEAFYGRDFDKEPEYLRTVERNGVNVPQVQLDFLVQADPEKHKTSDGPIDFKSRVTIYLVKNYRMGSKSGKYQIIDKYGRTAWATKEEIDNKQIPMYSNGPARIDKDYHVAYEGEEELINFLRAYLNISSPEKYVNNAWVMLEPSKLPDCEASLEHIEDYFKGDLKELKEVLSYQPNNKVKVCFGVKTTDEGRQYQTAYTRSFLRNSASNYSRLDEEIQSAKNNGSFSDTEFEVTDLHPYDVSATDFSASEAPKTAPKSPWGT